jgi:uncharacterized membrane protein YozB (DUF420 family)
MKASIKNNDKLANIVIITLSIVVFALVVLMRKVKLDIDFGFDTHVFPAISATLNSIVAILLVVGLYFVKVIQVLSSVVIVTLSKRFVQVGKVE